MRVDQMWKIEKPQIAALEAFDTCITGITNAELKQRLLNVRGQVNKAEKRFDSAAQNAKLYLVPSAKKVGVVTGKEMENLYDRHMARNKSRGRAIYDRLMIAAPFDQCPFCGHRPGLNAGSRAAEGATSCTRSDAAQSYSLLQGLQP